MGMDDNLRWKHDSHKKAKTAHRAEPKVPVLLNEAILVPVDKSRRDGIVLPYAARMARALDRAVVVVNAVSTMRALVPRSVREAEAYVQVVEAGLREEGLQTEGFVRRGNPVQAILDVTQERDVALIIMVTRGANALGKLLLGSVADGVLSKCYVPVLLLSEGRASVAQDDEESLKAAFLGTVVWHRETNGLYTRDRAEQELARLRGLVDERALNAAYAEGEKRAAIFGLLDHEFQMQTLHEFFPAAGADENVSADLAA